MDEDILNRTLEIINNDTIDETSLDELQGKVCDSFFLFENNKSRLYLIYKRFMKFFHQINIMVNLKQHHNI